MQYYAAVKPLSLLCVFKCIHKLPANGHEVELYICAYRVAPRVIPAQHKKKGQVKSVEEFTRTCTDRKAANAKKISGERNLLLENPAMEYKEYAVAVTSFWDKEFMQKFSTKSKSLVPVAVSCQFISSTKIYSCCWKVYHLLSYKLNMLFVSGSWTVNLRCKN
jgi:hypothetical protein